MLKKTGQLQKSEAMPDDGANPAGTTAIRLESIKDPAGQQAAEGQRLLVNDGLEQEAGNNVTKSLIADSDLVVVSPQIVEG